MFIDLTLSLSRDNPVLTRIPPPDKAPLFAAGHIGTHLDTLLHRLIPLDWMDRSGIIVDARASGADIGLDAIKGVAIGEGDFVFFHTGHIDRYPYGSEDYFHFHPQLDWPLIETLLDKRVSFIGVDAPGLRRGREEHAKVDRICEERGAYVIENLINLGKLQAAARGRFPVRVAWIAHEGQTGIPVKVVASAPDPV